METEHAEKIYALKSLKIYLPITVVATVLFLLAAKMGDYSPVAEIGGAVWVGILTLIVTMPLVTQEVKKRGKS